MSFNILETLRLVKAKANLYNFQYKGNNYLYTDHDVKITSGDLTYEPIFINRSNVKGSNDEARSEVEITVGNDNAISKLFRIFLPSDTITIIIKECHVSEPEAAINLFYGEVVGCEINEDESTLTALPINVLLNTKSARQTYQSLCNHILYKNGCKLNVDDFKFSATVINLSSANTIIELSRTINFSTVDTIYDNYLRSGIIITNNGEYKTIIEVISQSDSAGSVKVLTALSNLKIGDTVFLAPGCNRTSNHCKNKFSNFVNFRAFEFIPGKNNNPFNSL